jgi:hypothetical protein
MLVTASDPKKQQLLRKFLMFIILILSAGWFIILDYVPLLGHICWERNNLPVSVGARRYPNCA